jgi:membrane-associated PAP2 superfamily phosphatase
VAAVTDAAGAPARRFLLWHLGVPLAAALALLALEHTGLDRAVSNRFFDIATGSFPLRYSPSFEVVAHQWARYVVVLIGCAVITAYGFSFAAERLKALRRVLLFLSLALVLAPGAVSVLKAASSRYCPYDVVDYGGFAPHLGLFDGLAPGLTAGHCFPSGHASAGFCLLAFYFAGYALGNRLLALAGLWGGLGAGMAFGMARIAQGAHFLSHNLWSALVCWLVILALYLAVLGTPKGAQEAAAKTNTG